MSQNMISDKRLQGKDPINVSVFTVMYFVIVFAAALPGYIPIFMPPLCVLAPIVGGIPFTLFLTKAKKFGMIWTMSVIMGILMLLTGMDFYSILVGAVSGLTTELTYKSGDYRSTSKTVLASSVFSVWVWGSFISLFLSIDAHFSTHRGYGQEYIDASTRLMPPWMCSVLLIAVFISGLIDGLLGKTVLKKHLQKVGIA